MKLGWDVRLDDISHWLHLPRWIQHRTCGWLDRRLLGMSRKEYKQHEDEFH